MAPLWLAVVAVAVVNFSIKATGPVLLGRRQLPQWTQGVIALLAAALLAGLIVVYVLGSGWASLSWTMLGGLTVTASARLLKAPMLLAILAGVAVTASLRLLFG